MTRKLVLIDAHAIIHRAFHALPPLTAPDGSPTNAVYGFASILLKIFKELKPDYLAAAFDHEGKTFRHLAFERYKAHRQKAPDALYQQIPAVKDVLNVFGVPVIEKQGFEADDLIGTIAANARHKHKNIEVVIVTGDLDALQLVDGSVKVLALRKGITDTVLYDVQAVKERYGLMPEQLADFKGLCGDSSDNIPGVKGVGEKTATELLQAHGSIEGLYRALKKGELQVKPATAARLKARLKAGEADALFSKTLATIDCRAPANLVLAAAKVRKLPLEKIKNLFEQLGFYSLLRRLDGGRVAAASSAAALEPSGRGSVKGGARATRIKSFSKIPAGDGDYVVLFKEPADAALLAASGRNEIFRLPLRAKTFHDFSSWLGSRQCFAFDLKPLYVHGFPQNVKSVFDLKIIWWLLEPGRKNYSQAALAAKESRIIPASEEEIVQVLFDLAPRLLKRLQDEKLLPVYAELEAPLIAILYDMERAGIKVEIKPLNRLSEGMAGELARLEKKIHGAAGATFNINSPRQLAEVLFDKLGLTISGARKTEKLGVASTRESELLKLRDKHAIISDILAFREVAKLKSTYVDVLPTLVAADGRVHTTWNQTGTATGRLSSQSPNLQNIPTKSRYSRDIRKVFVAEEGFVLAAFDYSQLELRIAANLSGDEKMIEAFRQGQDIHALTASAVSGIAIGKVTPALRRKAKTLNFGILYGMGSRALAEAGEMTRDEARVFIEEYFRNFRELANFIAMTKDFARTHGFTKTAFGRKRFFPELGASSFRREREAERQAINHPIQGTAADIMKKAMIAVREFLQDRGLEDQIRFLLQIHDELILEVKKETAPAILETIGNIMESVWSGKVKMKVEIHQGRNWADLENG